VAVKKQGKLTTMLTIGRSLFQNAATNFADMAKADKATKAVKVDNNGGLPWLDKPTAAQVVAQVAQDEDVWGDNESAASGSDSEGGNGNEVVAGGTGVVGHVNRGEVVWFEYWDNASQASYFVNNATNESVWERPTFGTIHAGEVLH
jgi:hypothetical protein